VCGVVYQGSERSTGCQFTFTCDGSLARRPSGASWAQAQQIAAEALSGSVYAPVGLATHYHTLWVHPFWAGTLDHIGTIGAHRFYRTRGANGQAGAFTGGYAGFEPVVSGRTVPAAADMPVPAVAEAAGRPAIAYEPDPVPVRKQAASLTGASAPPQPATAPAPVEPAAGPGSVRPEFARAGQWKAQPGPAPAPVD
jgi:hypothetical protein